MKLRDVNTTDIGSAIRAGCRTMASVFNADDNDVPFFGSQAWPDPHLAFSSVHDEVTRARPPPSNALLTAESLGFSIDEEGSRETRPRRVLFVRRSARPAA